MKRTAIILACALLALPAAPAALSDPGAEMQAAEDNTLRVRGDRGQGAFYMSMMRLTRQFSDGGERLAFRHAFNRVFSQREQDLGITEAYRDGRLTEAEYQRERERVYRAMHGMTADEIIEAADQNR